MVACHGVHGYFTACGGVSGAAGALPLHQIGGLRHEATLYHLQRHKAASIARYGQEGYDRRRAAAQRKAAQGADLTPQQARILAHERRILAAQLTADAALAPADRARMRGEVTLLDRHLKRAARAAELRQQKTDLLRIQADHWARQAATRVGTERAVSQYYADKLGAELEAYTRREAVHYVYFGAGTHDTLARLFGHSPTRAEIAGALGVKPGSDITLTRRGGYLHAVVHDPGWSPLLARPDGASHGFDLFRDITGKLRRQPS